MQNDVENRESESLASLTSAEEMDLFRYERTIAANLAAFFKVAFALIEVKRRKLYRGEFKTFEEYCRKKWEMHKTYAYRLIGAAEAYKYLSTLGDIRLPESEGQVRPLTGLPPAVMSKAWKRAIAEVGPGGKITGAVVQKAVAKVIGRHVKPKDEFLRANWQILVGPLLDDARRLTQEGDQEAVAEVIERVSLLLLVGRRQQHCDAAE